ncbi:MAG: GGDEF domain-containing protein [Candidatus Adiutrix sp.]|jgi:diguanylate cyclase (GGDEF)-like protein|nr:GGDEF domain-containing protein [Candidatus Adiutrix sp.]
MREILYPLVNVDVKTLIAVLFWGNLVSVVLVFSYRLFSSRHITDRVLAAHFILGKAFQCAAYFFLFFRNALPDLLSVNLGNTLLMIGFYWEALAMMTIIKITGKKTHRLVTMIMIISVVVFNAVEAARPDSSLRVITASFCVFAMLIAPNIWLICSKDPSNFKKLIGCFYSVVLVLLLPRIVYAMFHHVDILTNFLIQTMTFLALAMLMIFSLPAYILLMKEDSDLAIITLATTDALTGLPNRHFFLDSAERVFNRHRGEGSPLALIFWDIDHFKKINDAHGHVFGDSVLVRLGAIVRESLRAVDLACRYGGEEFIALLPKADAVIAEKVAKRIMEQIAKSSFPQHPEFSFTASIGITDGVPNPDDTLEDFIKQADAAMYEAKNAGRNRIAKSPAGKIPENEIKCK